MLVAEVSHHLLPFIVVGHHMHVNYTNYTLRQPLGISLVREPVERFLSDFYYIRYGDEQTPENLRNLSPETYNRTLEECVNAAINNVKKQGIGNPVASIGKFCGCQLNHEIVRFCGYDKRCNYDPEFALQQAKENLNDYIAIGLTEELPEFFAVLERLIPDLFEGLLQVYNENTAVQKTIRKSKTFSKRRPSDEFLAKLRSLAFREYDFYYYVRERFRHLQMELKLVR
ncbi:uronyl 2-sulfotransferase-like [Amphiura filiformis]|uniref:uronyl 2-sulfotransferase-like n=1 Tax=Amphiura filiformis TaxID=82378 RepID=UPI003B21698B